LVEILDWLLAGDRELAEIFPEEAQAQHIVYFRDAEWHDDPVRVAYMFMFEPQAPHRRVVVQVGETLNKRKRLSNEIIAGIIIPQFFLFPVVALLAWFGLQRGTLPLERLRQRLLSRRPGDLSPINVREVPEEVAPLIRCARRSPGGVPSSTSRCGRETPLTCARASSGSDRAWSARRA
jgi:two-component system, OmpR family, sensor histidine kinase TctE